MRRTALFIVLGFACVCLGMKPFNSVKHQVQDWIDHLPADGWRFGVRETDSNKGLVGYCEANDNKPCHPDRADTLFLTERSNHRISLGFTRPVGPSTPLEQVQKSLHYVALDRLDVPDLRAEGWEISPLTPVSSFKEGVTITSFDGKRIRLTVDTSFFAVHGQATSSACRPLADAPSKKGCYLQIRKPFRGHIVIEMPIFSPPIKR